MSDELFDSLPGDGYPDGPVDSQGEPLAAKPIDNIREFLEWVRDCCPRGDMAKGAEDALDELERLER